MGTRIPLMTNFVNPDEEEEQQKTPAQIVEEQHPNPDIAAAQEGIKNLTTGANPQIQKAEEVLQKGQRQDQIAQEAVAEVAQEQAEEAARKEPAPIIDRTAAGREVAIDTNPENLGKTQEQFMAELSLIGNTADSSNVFAALAGEAQAEFDEEDRKLTKLINDFENPKLIDRLDLTPLAAVFAGDPRLVVEAVKAADQRKDSRKKAALQARLAQNQRRQAFRTAQRNAFKNFLDKKIAGRDDSKARGTLFKEATNHFFVRKEPKTQIELINKLGQLNAFLNEEDALVRDPDTGRLVVNPNIQQGMQSLLARALAGEVGVLTDQDIKRFAGNPAALEVAKRAFTKNIKGQTFTEQDIKLFAQAVQVVQKRLTEDLAKSSSGQAKLFKATHDLNDPSIVDDAFNPSRLVKNFDEILQRPSGRAPTARGKDASGRTKKELQKTSPLKGFSFEKKTPDEINAKRREFVTWLKSQGRKLKDLSEDELNWWKESFRRLQ